MCACWGQEHRERDKQTDSTPSVERDVGLGPSILQFLPELKELGCLTD